MYLISYDIESDRLRLRISRLLLRWGLHRVQYSVFMGTIGRDALSKLRKELDACSRSPQWAASDSVLIVPIHRSHVRNIQAIGQWPNRWEEIAGEVNTLMI
jgi:CRISPR-associated endonuclease Cas2